MRLARDLPLLRPSSTILNRSMEGKKMKSLTGKMIMIAAAMTVITGVASAQKLTADVPFAFRAGRAMLPAGSYTVQSNRTAGGAEYVILQNQDTRAASIVVPYQAHLDSQKTVATKLVFACGGGRCALAEFWNGADGYGQRFAKPKAGPGEWAKVVEVPLTRAAD